MNKLLTVVCFILSCVGCTSMLDVDYARVLNEQGQNSKSEEMLLSLNSAGYYEATAGLARFYANSTDPEKQKLAGKYYQELLKEDPEFELAYLRWMNKMSRVNSKYKEPTYRSLWQRQVRFGDVSVLLARFYSWHRDTYDVREIDPLFDQWRKQGIEQYRDVAMMFLNNYPFPEKYIADIDFLCSQPSTPESDLAVCHQLYLKLEKQKGDVDAIGKRATIITANYKQGLITDEDVFRCSRILIEDEFGESLLVKGVELAEIDLDSDRLFLLSARYELEQTILMSNDVLLYGLIDRADNGSREARLMLGKLYLKGYRVPDDPILAEHYLGFISDDALGAYYLGTLYVSGKLGAGKLQQGIDLLLYSARLNEAKSYKQLAIAFHGSPGIKANPTYVWVFSNMAMDSGIAKPEENSRLIQLLHDSENSRDKALSESLLKEEKSI
ncbi:hypothetical protein CXF93_04315 [Moritella sp. Urea-trap-13]|nr:hypothetical protein CXF93_04315 [Moritella sp. Urea-trap-13]